MKTRENQSAAERHEDDAQLCSHEEEDEEERMNISKRGHDCKGRTVDTRTPVQWRGYI